VERHYRHSIFFPLLLISVGVIYLLNVLGYIQGDWWGLFLKLWPLLFIIGGLDNFIMGRGYVWGVISLGLGALFLMANFGYVEWSSLTLLLRFWPLLLIAVGLDLIFRGRSIAMTIIGILLAVLMVGGVFWFTISGSTAIAGNTTQISQTLDSARQLTVEINNPTGQVDIDTVSSSDTALWGSVTLSSHETVDQNYVVQNGTGDLTLKTSGAEFLPWIGGFGQPLWNFNLTNSVPVSLTIETAAGRQQIDLIGMDLEYLHLSVAVGQIDVTLPAAGNYSGKLTNPVGGIKITVPSGALVEFQTNSVIVSRSLSEGFTVSGNKVYSPGANSQNSTMHITIDQPIGRLIFTELQ
jgi:hypothetical protein